MLILPLAAVAIGFGVWGVLALWYRAPYGPTLAALWGVAALAILVALVIGPRRKASGVLAVCVGLLLAWWSTLQPASDADWAPEVAQTVEGTAGGDTLTLTHVRNFDWRGEHDFTPRWETRQYDLSKLVGVDLISDYWAGEAIAHTMVSFDFSDGRFLTWSIEMRRRRDQVYSTIEGFFKQAELVVLAGDERDLIRLRTNVRKEDLRLYRLRASPEIARKTLLAYVEEANDLAKEPRWYNTATTNCTTVVFKIAQAVEPGFPLDWRVLLSGYLPDYAYDHGALDQSLPFPELRERAKIAARAQAADAEPSPAFSQAIRSGAPALR
jgi:hypothetical protein